MKKFSPLALAEELQKYICRFDKGDELAMKEIGGRTNSPNEGRMPLGSNYRSMLRYQPPWTAD